MRYPKPLMPGETIGVTAPAFGATTNPYKTRFANVRKRWEEEGYRLLIGENCFASDGIGISTTPEKCAAELQEMFASEADIVLNTGGGELMCEIVPYLDFDALKALPPKWYMGSSDNTNFIYPYVTIADTAAIYGPCAPAFGMRQWHPCLQDAFDLLTGKKREVHSYGLWEKAANKDVEDPGSSYHLTELLQMTCYVGEKKVRAGEEVFLKGRLLGGCLDCLQTLCGTPYDATRKFAEKYKDNGILWFLEACDLNVFAIRRAMWQLYEAGWFEHASGFLIGRPLNGEPMMNLNAIDAVLEFASRFQVPIVFDADLGHLPPTMPVVVGSLAEVTATEHALQLRMNYQ